MTLCAGDQEAQGKVVIEKLLEWPLPDVPGTKVAGQKVETKDTKGGD
jgi:hypothetical protein